MKQKRYWLRIGMLGIILGPIVWFCYLKLAIPTSVEVTELPLYDAIVLGLIVYGSAALIGFIVGSIIGWIYDSVKKRKYIVSGDK